MNAVYLVEKLKQIDISENSILSSFDIVSMYTSIDVSKSEQLLQNKLENNYHLIEESAIGLDIDVLMHLVKLCNKYSMHFQFRDSYYNQVRGLPMGAPLSGLLANIFVENLENWALDSYFLNHVFWGRFMDDIISVWNYGESELKGFLEHLNTYDRNLQFTLETERDGKIPFLDVLIIRSVNKLDFTVYRKPTHNNRYLHFKSNHPPQVKRGVVISLVDRVLNICSEPYVKKELNFITDILFGNGYPISLINTVIAQRLKMHSSKALNPTPVNDSNKPTSTIYLPYIPKITSKMKKVCLKNNLRVVFTSNLSIMNLVNSGKDKTPITRLRGVYQIPCSCGNYYIGRTHQNLGTRLQQHKESIEKALKSKNNSISFDSALSSHIFENPNHYVLFDETILISNDLGIKQTVREAIEIKRNLNNNKSLNRDLGEYTLNPMYTKLIIENNLIQNKTKIGINKNKPNIKRTIRLAAEKANIAIRNQSNF